MELANYLVERQTQVEDALTRFIALDGIPSELLPLRLVDAMRYSLLGGGKRLRPILTLAAAEAIQPDRAMDAMPFACAMECIHTYSLIHDDLPAMDDDDLRRGRPTNHVQFDEATAILAGDALLTLAFELCGRTPEHVPTGIVLKLVTLLSQAAGVSGMVGGQMLDLQAEHQSITLAQLKTIHGSKTGALIRCSCEAGARIAGGDTQQVASLSAYGTWLGLAFQIRDDLLDVLGDTQKLGKPIGSDEKNDKATYPKFLGLDGAKQAAEQAVTQALECLENFPGQRAEPLRELAR
ncbi:MAG: polyprenyl synthetase family protein, partial [Magnetococcales bacterium]|nr:polyprenyl synthetase family protein [Magnetococcales bacterium]